MPDEFKPEDIKIRSFRLPGLKRQYSTYVEVSANPRDVNLKFSDLKPPETPEELERIKKELKVEVPVDNEIVLPIDVAQSLLEALTIQLNIVKENMKGEKKDE